MGEFWFRLFRPSFWMMSKKYSKAWDEHVLRAIANSDIYRTGEYTALVGDRIVWVANYPYSFGHGYGRDLNDLRPSAQTVQILADAVALAPHYSLKSIEQRETDEWRDKQRGEG